ncbi:MAG: transporter substrate-binding domain-containing protein [Acetobacterium sp.]|nr:transporter substrate-binding domain-containing protein [Acetobacterium sp.]
MKSTGRMVIIVLAITMMFTSLVGCGKQATQTTQTTQPTAKNYVIYSDNSFAPFEYYDSATSKYVGLDMDILAAIAADQKITYEIKNEGFDASMGAVQSGQADAMIAGMTITDKRKATFDFSDGYFQDGQIMMVGANSNIKSLEDLKGSVVAVKTSTQGAEYAKGVAGKYGFTLQYYEDSPTMYTAVTNGTNAAGFEDFSVIGWAIKHQSLKIKTVGEVINPGSYGFAVKKGSNAELIQKFNAGLANIKANGKYKEILTKYGY